MAGYTLTYVTRNGQAYTTSAIGYRAEQMMDEEFKVVRTDPKVLYAVLISGDDKVRAKYHGE